MGNKLLVLNSRENDMIPFFLDLSGALITDQDCPNIMSKEDNPNALMDQYQTKEGDKNGH